MNSGQHPTKHETGNGVAVPGEEIVVRKYYLTIAGQLVICRGKHFHLFVRTVAGQLRSGRFCWIHSDKSLKIRLCMAQLSISMEISRRNLHELKSCLAGPNSPRKRATRGTIFFAGSWARQRPADNRLSKTDNRTGITSTGLEKLAYVRAYCGALGHQLTNPPWFGIFTLGSDFASSVASPGTMPSIDRMYALTA